MLIWPLLRSLRAEGAVTWVAGREKAALAARWIPGLRGVDGESPDFSGLFADSAGVSETAAALLRGESRIISFVSRGDDAWAANVRAIAGAAAMHFVEMRPPPGRRVGVVEFHFEQLRRQRLSLEPVRPERRWDSRGGPVVIHPGSGGAGKVWPVERWEAVLEHLARAGRRAEVMLGEVERERWDAGVIERWRERYEVVEPSGLIEMSERIAGASMFVGVDSGPGHVAAALGVATVSLFGPSDAAVWGPWGPAVRVVAPSRAMGMEWLSVEKVVESLAWG